MQTIKIVRLKTGDDLVGYYNHLGLGKFELAYPMRIEFHNNIKNSTQVLTMGEWLPNNLCKNKSVELFEHDVLTILEPTDDFAEYFTHSLKEIEDRRRAVQELEMMRSDNDFGMMEEAIAEAEMLRELNLLQ